MPPFPGRAHDGKIASMAKVATRARNKTGQPGAGTTIPGMKNTRLAHATAGSVGDLDGSQRAVGEPPIGPIDKAVCGSEPAGDLLVDRPELGRPGGRSNTGLASRWPGAGGPRSRSPPRCRVRACGSVVPRRAWATTESSVACWLKLSIPSVRARMALRPCSPLSNSSAAATASKYRVAPNGFKLLTAFWTSARPR